LTFGFTIFSGGTQQSHDPRKIVAPSYSFGVKHKNFSSNHSPGPKFMVNSALTRNGVEGSPKVSLPHIKDIFRRTEFNHPRIYPIKNAKVKNCFT